MKGECKREASGERNRDLEELSVADLFALSRENSAKLAAGLDPEDFKAIMKSRSRFPNL